VSLAAILLLGLVLGMRHATDADHVVAISTIVSRERSLRAAAPVGVLWGLGHTVTILLVGGLIVLFGVVIPPRVGLAMELAVAIMLVTLGAWNVAGARRSAPDNAPRGRIRPVVVGVVHGLAGSAAIALLVLGTIHDAAWSVAYLFVFGVGTVVGMLLVTFAMALPIAATARRFERLHQALAVATGAFSVAFGGVLVYQIGIVHGLFTGHPAWTPH